MHFEKIEQFDNLEMTYLSDLSRGYISRNRAILSHLTLTPLTQFILEKCVYGTPVFKMGDGGNKILILSGVHGNELPPQIASLKLINEYIDRDLNHTLFFIPFVSPNPQ